MLSFKLLKGLPVKMQRPLVASLFLPLLKVLVFEQGNSTPPLAKPVLRSVTLVSSDCIRPCSLVALVGGVDRTRGLAWVGGLSCAT